MFKNKITYKYYEQSKYLIIYNYITRETLFFEDVSAVILYNILTNNENKNSTILSDLEISKYEYNNFLSECDLLLSCDTPKNIFKNNLIEIQKNKEFNEILKQEGILFGMHIDITPKCNLRCIHCYHPFEKYDNFELSLNNIKEMFEIFNKLGVFKITLSGGEPFLRKDIIDIIKLGNKYNFVFEIFTNGTLLTEKTIKTLSNLNVSKLSFSYYGNKKSYHHITGKDYYDILMNNVMYCQRYGIDFDLKFISMKSNYDQIDNFYKLAKKINIRPAIELNLTPKIDASRDNLSEKLDVNDYINIFHSNKEIFKHLLNSSEHKNDDIIQCNAGKYGLYCDYTGNIYPCVSYRKLLGSFKDLEQIWFGTTLEEITHKKNMNFNQFNKYSYCKYCYEICPGLSLLEGKSDVDCNNSGCLISKAIEYSLNL